MSKCICYWCIINNGIMWGEYVTMRYLAKANSNRICHQNVNDKHLKWHISEVWRGFFYLPIITFIFNSFGPTFDHSRKTICQTINEYWILLNTYFSNWIFFTIYYLTNKKNIVIYQPMYFCMRGIYKNVINCELLVN